MSEIRIELATEFKGATVVLLTMDTDGLDVLRAALGSSLLKSQGFSRLVHAGTTHEFALGGAGIEIKLQPGRVTWHFPEAKLAEVLEKLDAMRAAPGPCHHYVDISDPAKTLVLSRDEYL